MKKTYISDVAGYKDKEITVRGWLYNKRSSGKVWFLIVRDGTGMMQCVVSKADVSERSFQACEEVTQESSLSVTGLLRIIQSHLKSMARLF
jgi:asparaginyl-tRNA synthetase